MTNKLTAIQQMQDQIEAEVREELSKHSDAELLQLVAQHLYNPSGTVIAAISMNPGKLCAMAAVTIFRELIRRAEVRELEANHA